jgi:lysine 2,3-aminomutase
MSWQRELKSNITSIDELAKHIDITEEERIKLENVISKHPMSVTRYYLSLIDTRDPNDPIKKMIIPSVNELDVSGSYDPSDELSNTKMPGLQHKYSQTALILATNRCTAYCRHCFRKRLVGLTSEEILRRIEDSVDYIHEHTEINNVLISGGDPFALETEIIEKFLEMLSHIPHLDFIRFGTRTPVVFPSRILHDKKLTRMMKKYSSPKRRLFVVTQFNHPREITDLSTAAINELTKNRIIVNNQTVLLKDVNDDPDVLVELLNKLVSIGVNPYYIFKCRPVKRVKKHFQVPFRSSCRIIREANKRLNGHSKRFRYAMSHKAGKIEILGIMGDEIYFKFHEAKNPNYIGMLFKRSLSDDMGWLDESIAAQYRIEPIGEAEQEQTG